MEHFGACVASVIIISFSALCTMANLSKNSPFFFSKEWTADTNKGFNQRFVLSIENMEVIFSHM
jgi:hypothetical protein